MRILLLLTIFILNSTPVFSISIEKTLDNKILEQRAKDLFKEIRCMSCSGESINDSRAILAQNMKHKIRQMILNKQTDDEILGYFSQKYGNNILMKPPTISSTYLLWTLPAILIFLGLWIIRNKYITLKQFTNS